MSNPNDPGKDKARPGDANPPKKPYATIDLKATEVAGKATAPTPGAEPAKPEASKADPGKPEAGKVEAWRTPTTGTTDAAKAKETVAATGTAVPGVKPGDSATPSPAKPEVRKADAKTASPPPAAAVAAQPARRGGFFSHLVAGIVGGAAVILGAEPLGQLLGMPNADQSTALLQRVAALEAAQSRAGGAANGDLARKLADSEGRLARLEDSARVVAQLTEASNRLAAETKGLQEKVGQGGAGNVGERVAKLEETLATLAAAGQSDQAGRLPQLAALTARIRELETSLGAQTAQVRRDLAQALETRTQQVGEAGEVARAATQRIDRDLSAVKTEAATLTQRMEALKADSDRTAERLRVVQEETGAVRSGLDGLKGDVDSRMRSVARPNDVTAALAPVTSKIAEIEQGLQGVVRSEADRRSNAERIVLSLELANLKRALDRGQAFETELADVKKTAAGRLDLAPLERHKARGVLTPVELSRDFRGASKAILDADSEPVDGTVVDRLLAGAKSIVRVRKVEHASSDKSAEAVVARMETALKDGRLGQVLDEAKALPPRAQDAARDWLAKVEARHSVDRALAAVEGQLKSALGGSKAQN
jgi:hypothetical protein